jgi:large subunit ribosomal protein L24
MWLKKKDKVLVLAGRDKGKRGEILDRVDAESFMVAQVNIVKRHTKPKQNQKSGIIDKEMPMHQSKLMLVCGKCDSATRPKVQFLKDGEKVRVCRKCGETIE